MIRTILLSSTVIISGYIFLGFLFYIFLKNLQRDPKSANPPIHSGSWHFKLAYPFKSQSGDYKSQLGFLRYFSKLFLMLFLGWPILISWEIIKFIIYNPILFLFGAYSMPSLEAMRDEELPFATKVKYFYVPAYIYPIYIFVTVLFCWLAYKWPIAVGVIAGGILVVGSLIFGIFYADNKGYIGPIIQWLIIRKNLFMDKYVHKYNYTINVKSE